MDHIKSQLDRIAELGTEEVSALQEQIVSEFEQVEQEDPTPQSVDAMTQLADMLDTVRGEVKRREAEAEELSARAAEASSRIRAEEVQPEGEPEESIPTTEPEVDGLEEEEVDDDETLKEASSATEKSSEFATEEPTVEEAPAAAEEFATEEAVVEAPAEAEASTETEAEAEAAVEEAPAEESAPEAEASIQEEQETPTEQTAQEEATVTAAANEPAFEAPADRRPVAKVIEAPVAITAGADIQGITAGSTLSDMKEVARAMEKRIHSLRHVNGGDGEQHIVASVSTQYPTDRILNGLAEENSAKIREAKHDGSAIVASGGWGGPVEQRYDVFGFDADPIRPIRDALPRFQAERGGVRIVTAPNFENTNYALATGVWTNEDDINAVRPDGPRKNVMAVGGVREETVYIDAITLQLQFGNLMTRAYPELIARHNELALVQHAREAEINLLNKINSYSKAVTSTSRLGFARDFLVTLKLATAGYRARHRIGDEVRLQAIVPSWVQDAMAADLIMQMPGDDVLGTGRAEIQRYLDIQGVDMISTPDQGGYAAMQAAGATLQPFPTQFDWFLFPEGSFLFLDGGTLDLGIIRDSGLVGTNDYRMFVETFEGLAFVGVEALRVTTPININGTAAALEDTRTTGEGGNAIDAPVV